MRCDLTIYQ
jgi:hypothetical protein